MEYSYFSATGIITVEIDEQWLDLLIDLDRDEFNSERKHRRRHPIPLESCLYEGEWFDDGLDSIGEVDAAADMELALATLTELQRICFVETRLYGKPQRALAAELGKSPSTIQRAVEGAAEILKIFFA